MTSLPKNRWRLIDTKRKELQPGSCRKVFRSYGSGAYKTQALAPGRVQQSILAGQLFPAKKSPHHDRPALDHAFFQKVIHLAKHGLKLRFKKPHGVFFETPTEF